MREAPQHRGLAFRLDVGGPVVAALLKDLTAAGIRFKDLHTTQSSLEDIFVTLVSDRK